MRNTPRIEVIDEQTAAILRAKTPAERLQIASKMWTSARTMLQNLVRAEHPDWPEEQVQTEVSRRMSHGTG